MSKAPSVIETVAKYFYFLTLNDQITFSASFRALGDLKARGWLEPDQRTNWIWLLARWRAKLKHIPPKNWAHSPDDIGFNSPEGLSLSAWRNFLECANPVEIEAVLLSRVLGFEDIEISRGLGVTVGTVRYRVGRGLRHLGGYLES